jgi:hypothetical protein
MGKSRPRRPSTPAQIAARAAKKAAQAAADAKRRAEIAAISAIRAEADAEEQAPRQQRIGASYPLWNRATKVWDQVVIPPLAEHDTKRGGFRRPDSLMRLALSKSGLINGWHLRAGTRFREDYEIGIEGISLSPGIPERVDGSSTGAASDSRLDAISRYRAACDAMGPSLRSAVQLLVIWNRPVSAIAKICGLSQDRTSGYLAAGLDRLADHYFPDQTKRLLSDQELVVDPEVTDLPQERLGRFRRRGA